MEMKHKIEELQRLIAADPTSSRIAELAREIKEKEGNEDNQQLIDNFVASSVGAIDADVKKLHEDTLKLQLEEIGGMLNISYIAKRYFKRSRAWLSQRINGNVVNGKPCRFTDQELEIFNNALHDMSIRLQAVKVGY